MTSDLHAEIDGFLAKLPGEVHLDLAEAATRLQREPSLKQKIQGLLADRKNGERIFHELFGCGPLEPLLTDTSVTEIIVNGPVSIWYERTAPSTGIRTAFIHRSRCRNSFI